MRCTYHIEAIRFSRADRPAHVVDRLMVRANDIEAVKRQTILLYETARDSRWCKPKAEALRVVDQTGAERFRCSTNWSFK